MNMNIVKKVEWLYKQVRCLLLKQEGNVVSPEYTLSPVNASNTFNLLKDGIEVSTIDLTQYLNTNSATLNGTTITFSDGQVLNIEVVVPTGLEALDEGNGIGWRLIGVNPDNYGSIGLGAVDTSTSLVASLSFGATGNYANVSGFHNIGDDYSNVAGQNNTAGQWSNVTGKRNTGSNYANVSGEDNTGGDYSNVSGTFNTGGYASNVVGSGNIGGDFSNISGTTNTGGDLSSISGGGNTGEYASNVSGSENTGGQFSSISGSHNIGVDHTLVAGQNNTANNPSETVIGEYATELPQDSSINGRLFTVGNGTSIQNVDMRSDAFTVYKSGAMGLYPLDLNTINPLLGMQAIDIDNRLKYYDGSEWKELVGLSIYNSGGILQGVTSDLHIGENLEFDAATNTIKNTQDISNFITLADIPPVELSEFVTVNPVTQVIEGTKIFTDNLIANSFSTIDAGGAVRASGGNIFIEDNDLFTILTAGHITFGNGNGDFVSLDIDPNITGSSSVVMPSKSGTIALLEDVGLSVYNSSGTLQDVTNELHIGSGLQYDPSTKTISIV